MKIMKTTELIERIGLNPCYSGICSVNIPKVQINKQMRCLNPCYSGICSVKILQLWRYPDNRVLILVIVEYAL